MQTFFFGGTGRQLFGALHLPAPSMAVKAGVLLCNPFGQEAIRAHRALRGLADRLARCGYAVMRFDYWGTGDAMGGDEDIDLLEWEEDALTADRVLSERTGVHCNVWIGMRLGAVVALRAARRAPAALRQLVLWEPVVDGAAYLQELRTSHVENLAVALGVHQQGNPRVRATDPRLFQDEACGFPLSQRFRDQVAAVQPNTLLVPDRPVTVVVTNPKSTLGAAAGEWVQALAGRAIEVPSAHDIVWTSESMDEGNLVPGPALATLIKVVEGA